jgi:ABC-type uncharacterized transport system involved in gliding motility auxiliary subunit
LYTVETVNLSTAPLPTDLKALWLVGPEQKMGPAASARLKEWLENGGTLGLLVDRYRVKIEQFQPITLDNDIPDLLKEWGIDFKSGLVFDPQCDRIQVRSQQGYFQMINVIDYPYFPMVSDLNRENPATKDLDVVSLPFVSPLVVDKPLPELTYTILARSSPDSWLNPFPYQVSPVANQSKPTDAIDGPFPLGLVVEGKFKKDDPNAKPGRLIVFGGSRFVRSDYPLRPTNYAAFVNLLDWSAQDEVLLSIRSKGNPRRPIKNLSGPARGLAKILMMLFLPVFVVIIGLVLWVRQRVRLAALPQVYRET